MRARGIAGVQIAVALGAIAAIVAVICQGLAWHAELHFARGEAATKAKWEEENRKAEEKRRQQDAEVGRALLLAEKARLAAEQEASRHESNWRRAVRESAQAKVALGECAVERHTATDGPVGTGGSPGGSGLRPPPMADGAALDPARVGVRVTWEFVRQFDTAWTGIDGKPVSPLARGGDEAARAGPSPYWLEDVRDVAGENAIRCSEDRARFAALIQKIEDAANAWDKGER